jgi:hypothetical protein
VNSVLASPLRFASRAICIKFMFSIGFAPCGLPLSRRAPRARFVLRRQLLVRSCLMASALLGARAAGLRFDESRSSPQRKSNAATMNPHGGSSDERAIADT